VALEDPSTWARQAVGRVRELVGGGKTNEGIDAGNGSALEEWRRSRLSRALTAAAEEVANEWDERLTGAALALMEHPGRRVAAAETALKRFVSFCAQAAAGHAVRREQQAGRTQQSWQHVKRAVEGCVGGGERGWSLFGNRSRRMLRVV